MKVVGHQHPAEKKKSGFLAEVAQGLGKDRTETLTSEQARTAICAGGDKLQLPGLEPATVDGHMSSIDGINAKRESQSWIRSAPASPSTATMIAANSRGRFAKRPYDDSR